MRFSLQTREIIADSIETVTCAQHHDANIAIPGCDKNMPGVIMVSMFLSRIKIHANVFFRQQLAIIAHSL
jgi:dihydroxyacid dehydratase/phosphogluconate dehydratase